MLFVLPFLAAMHICYAQTVITGQVISKSDQSAVSGATVIVKGTKIGTATNIDGRFSVRAKDGDILVVTGVGITRQEVTVSGDQNLTITVTTDAKNLNEVVVTATGIKKEAKKLGYAVQEIKAADLSKAREPNVINSLKGNVAGLVVDINNEIGRSPGVYLRGEGSPMYVVDGVPMSSDTYNINPDDIETFTVLKGPNAAALYGFQGREGAIIITTKKGSKNKRGFQIDFNSTTQINKGYLTFPKIQNQYGPGEYGNYGFVDGRGSGENDADYDIWGPQFRGQLLPQFDGPINPGQTYTTTFKNGDASIVNDRQPTPWLARGKNNLNNFLQTPLLSTNSIAVSSSTDKADIRFSAGNTYQKGSVPNTTLNTTNFAASITYRFSKKLSLSTNINYTRQATPNLPDVNYGPNSTIYNLILWSGADWDVKSPEIRNIWQPGKINVQQMYAEYYQYNNPWFLSYEWLRGHYTNQINGYMTVNYKVTNDIDLLLRPSLNTYDLLNTQKMPWSANEYGRREQHGDYNEDRRSLFESNVEIQARYHKNSILGFLDVQGLLGGNARNWKFNSD
ncbi:MAG TPA: carboxypeptidase-like regulatory domain-containing protein, partial [Puia sp.]|nr:carboxypeptidase-like regulatory domain-containing protein [Puia sp.]